MSNRPDFHALLAAARRHEAEAIDALFSRFYRPVRRMVHRGLQSQLRPSRPWLMPLFSTGDLVQEVFCNVLRDLDAFEGDSEAAFTAYLASTVRHRLIDAVRFHEAVRRDRRRHRDSDPEQRHATEDPAEEAATAEELREFAQGFANLRPHEQALVRERLEHGHNFRAIAASLGYATPDAARKAFYAAQARLLVTLKRAGVDLTGDP